MSQYTDGSSTYRKVLDGGRQLVIRARDQFAIDDAMARGIRPQSHKKFVASILTAEGLMVTYGYGDSMDEAEVKALLNLQRKEHQT